MIKILGNPEISELKNLRNLMATYLFVFQSEILLVIQVVRISNFGQNILQLK
jgi:hypothetical protein